MLNADAQLNPGLTGTNMFAYCNNNPVMLTDSDGTMPFLAITCIIGAIAGAVIGGIIAAKSGGNILAGIGLGAAGGALLGLGIGAGLAMISGAGLMASASLVGAGLITKADQVVNAVSTGLQKVGTKVSNVIQKAITKSPPSNAGVDFIPGKQLGSIQEGVNPNTLIPQKVLSTLSPQRIQNAVKFAGDKSIEVSQSGIIQQGHHRVADAIATGRAVDVVITVFGD